MCLHKSTMQFQKSVFNNNHNTAKGRLKSIARFSQMKHSYHFISENKNNQTICKYIYIYQACICIVKVAEKPVLNRYFL